MNTPDIQNYIEANLSNDDKLQFIFMGLIPPSVLLTVMSPLFASIDNQPVFVAITKKHLILHITNKLCTKFLDCVIINYSEIENIKIGKGFIQRTVNIILKDGLSIKIKAQVMGSNKIPKFNNDMSSYVNNKILENKT